MLELIFCNTKNVYNPTVFFLLALPWDIEENRRRYE